MFAGNHSSTLPVMSSAFTVQSIFNHLDFRVFFVPSNLVFFTVFFFFGKQHVDAHCLHSLTAAAVTIAAGINSHERKKYIMLNENI